MRCLAFRKRLIKGQLKGEIHMSETIEAAIMTGAMAAAITLLTSILTLIVNARIEIKKRNIEIQQKYYEIKRENLNGTYQKLLSIVNYYPNVSPNDILKSIEYPPNYSMESFDAIITILGYQIEDYSNNLKREGLDFTKKGELEIEISNREYVIKQIEQIRDDYIEACNKYNDFCKNDKMIFDLYAGQDVKNTLVEFEVIIHNTFKSGRGVGDIYDSTKNIIDIARHNMTVAMRNDIGLN